MGGADDREMAPVEGGDPIDAQALGDGDERGIGPAETEVRVPLNQVGHAHDVGSGQLCQLQPAGPEVAKKPDLDVGSTPLVEEVTDLRQHGGWNKERLSEGLEQPRRGVVVCVCGSGSGDEDVRVDEDHSRPKPRWRYSSVWVDRSAGPPCTEPMKSSCARVGRAASSPLDCSGSSSARTTCRRWPGRTPWRRSSASSSAASSGTVRSQPSAEL